MEIPRRKNFQGSTKQVQRHKLPHANFSHLSKSSEILGLFIFPCLVGQKKKSRAKEVFLPIKSYLNTYLFNLHMSDICIKCYGCNAMLVV